MDTPLKRARLAAGKSLSQVALDLGFDKGNLSRIERGVKRSSLDLAERLADYFGTVSEIEILYPERFTKPAGRRSA